MVLERIEAFVFENQDILKLALVHWIIVSLIAAIPTFFATFTGFKVRVYPLIWNIVIMVILIRFYIKRKKEEFDPIKIGLGFGLIASLNFLISLLGSLVFAPMMVFQTLVSVLSIPYSFLLSTGIFYLFKLFDTKQLRRLLGLTYAAIVPIFGAYQLLTSQPINLNSFLGFLIQESTIYGFLTAFIAIYSLKKLPKEFADYDQRLIIPAILGLLGLSHLVLSYLMKILTLIYYPEFASAFNQKATFFQTPIVFLVYAIIFSIETKIREKV